MIHIYIYIYAGRAQAHRGADRRAAREAPHGRRSLNVIIILLVHINN